MKNQLLHKIFSFAAIAIIGTFSLGSASGQGVKLVPNKPTFDDLQSPEYSGGGRQKLFKPKNWLEIEVKLNLAGGPALKNKVCERLTIKWYVAVKNPDRPGTMFVLTKDVEHVNIPYDEDMFCSVYLSPISVKLITGSDRPGKGSVEAVGYEVLVNGVRVAAESVGRGKVGWWTEPSDKLSRTESIPLLNKSETPFSALWWDRYAEVSAARGLR